MKRFLSSIVALALISLVGGSASAAELSGRLELLKRRGSHPDRDAEPKEAVVWWEPATVAPPDPLPGPVVMSTENKEFVPRVLVVTPGTTVSFPNADPILHNVFSVSGENSFDLGFYGEGAGKEHAFAEPGVVRIFCNVHHSMVGYVVVLDTAYFARPDRDGRFVLKGIPDGPGRLVAWYERSEETAELVVERPGTEPVEISLRVTKPQVPAHLNKTGQPYRRPGDEY